MLPKVLISHLGDGEELNGEYCLKRNPANYRKLLYGLCLEAFRKTKDNSISENLKGNRSSGKEEDDRNDWCRYSAERAGMQLSLKKPNGVAFSVNHFLRALRIFDAFASSVLLMLQRMSFGLIAYGRAYA